MMPTPRTKLSRVLACRSDLLDNGIDLYGPGHRQLCGLVRRNLAYFQAMLGYDADLREVVTLVEGARHTDRESSRRLAGAGAAVRSAGRAGRTQEIPQ